MAHEAESVERGLRFVLPTGLTESDSSEVVERSDVSDEDKSADNEEEELGGLAGLSALVGGSVAPSPMDDDEEDGKLDLAALVASVAPPSFDDEDDDEEEDEADEEDADDEADEAESAEAAPEPVEKPKKASKKKKKKKKAPSKSASSKSAPKAEPESEPPAAVATPAEVAQPSKGGGGQMWVGVAIGVVAAAAIGFFVMQNNATEDESDPIASAAPSVAGTETAAPDPTPGAAAAPEEAPGEPEDPVADSEAVEAEGDPEGEAEAEGEAEGEAEAGTPRRRRARRGGSSSAAAGTPSEPATAPSGGGGGSSTASPPSGGGSPPSGGGVSNILDQALGGRPNREGTGTTGAAPSRRPPSGGGGADLPDTPSRGDVARTLGRLMGRIRACAGDQVGLAPSRIIIRNDGSVATASVGGSPFGGTPQGACMEGVIRGAHFPPFRRATFSMNYPFSVR